MCQSRESVSKDIISPEPCNIVRTMIFPKMAEVRQKFYSPKLGDLANAVMNELAGSDLSFIKPGSRIAITAGSRGISRIVEILAIVVDEVKKRSGRPFIVPSMGSHGGATAEGQVQVLKLLGITPESVGAPIVSSMEVEEVGKLSDWTPVYVDKNALHSDGIIVVNRVKPHTDFKGEIESGLMKMMVIGLGKQRGAESLHSHGAEGYHNQLIPSARIIMEKAPIKLGLALVENKYHEIAIVKAIPPERIEGEEKQLLRKSKEYVATLPFKELDVLIIDEMGKDISGGGMDTNVTGRFWVPGEAPPDALRVRRVVVLDLTEGSHGNAIGVGLADVTTKKLVDKIDFHATYVNGLTTCWTETTRIPVTMPTDRDAIEIALRTCGLPQPERARMVRIKNTLELERIYISESILGEVRANPNIEIVGSLQDLPFDILGILPRM